MASRRRFADRPLRRRPGKRLGNLGRACILATIVVLSPFRLGATILLDAAETATAAVVGQIEQAAAIDLHGWAAWLIVERTLRGDVAPGDRLRIGWEELARGRAPRFADGDRVLVALGPLPPASLWYARFAENLRQGRVFAVAAEGQAYRHDPADRTVGLLGAYLAALADGSESQRHAALADLAGAPDAALANAAIERLGDLHRTGEALANEVATKLEALLRDEAQLASVRARLAEMAGTMRWQALRPALDAAAVEGGAIEAAAIGAVAAFDGGLSAERVAALWQREDPALRALAVAHATDPERVAALPGVLRDDPAPSVRAAAAEAVLLRDGAEGLAAVRPALADPAPEVRDRTATALAALGDAVVAPLEEILRDGSFPEASAAVLALHRVGDAGRAAIQRLAVDAPDERLRDLAKLALGQLETHSHD